ncbi:MAG: S8 family serine peptidase, partial [Calditrichia bacterium]|nr:S8 family serine peptidase [Calditrichia bacterium]
MRKGITLLALMLFIVSSFFQTLSAEKITNQNNEEVKFVKGEFVVKFKTNGPEKAINTNALNSVLGKYNVKEHRQLFKNAKNTKAAKSINLYNVFIMQTDKGSDIIQIVKELNKEKYVEYAEPNYISKMDDTIPNDTYYDLLSHIPQVYAPAAWDVQNGTSGVIIGIIDSGVDWDHDDLAAVIWSNDDETVNGADSDGNGYIDDIRGWDFVANGSNPHSGEDATTPDNNPMDFDGHGTHVSGLAAAHTNNSTGVAAVSWGASVMPLRCGWRSADGNGYVGSTYAAEAYTYAADNGAHITNQSSGSSGQTIIDAAYYAFQNGVLICESAGNGNDVTPSALGGQDFVMTVAAVNSIDRKASYSSYGEYVDISAPGGDFSPSLYSTVVEPSNFYSGPYAYMSGTSMASPVTASVAGLILQAEPSLSVLDLYTRVLATADDIDGLNPTYVGMLGAGRVNAYRGVTETANATPEFMFISTSVDDAAGNGNGIIEAGESFTINVTIRNTWANAAGVNATISDEGIWPFSVVSGIASIGDLPGILDKTSWQADASFDLTCDANAFPTTVDVPIVITTDGGYEQTLSFPVAVSPQVLVVGDWGQTSGGGTAEIDQSDYYKDALDNAGIGYQYVDRRYTTVDAAMLSNYPIVIWACEWAFPSLDADDRTALGTFLDAGGRLFISGQDIGWDMCDATGGEYGESSGASKTWYENYLKSTYVADDAGQNSISGVGGDPISDGLTSGIYQPDRPADNQYPSQISPRETGVSIFTFGNGTTGATRYSGTWRVVNFAFGGFEAVTEESVRFTIMQRVIDWMNGISLEHTPLTDTENTTDPYDVTITVNSELDAVSNVQLFWDTDGAYPYTIVDMTDEGAGVYSTTIPAQAGGTDVSYFIVVSTVSGTSALTEEYQFHVGEDTTIPTIELTNLPIEGNIVNAYGLAPYQFELQADDNSGINPSTAYLYFGINEEEKDSLLLSDQGDNQFTGTFSFVAPISAGNTVSYYFSIKDNSSNANRGVSETYSYMVDSTQFIEGFENELSWWNLGDDWGLSSLHHDGAQSITDSPDGNYPSNADNSLTYQYSFNLSNYQWAQLELYVRHYITDANDYCAVEISVNGGTVWSMVTSFSGTQMPQFAQRLVDISDYTGASFDDVRLRFRMVSDGSTESAGIWIDDVSINGSEKPNAIIETG